ncbi:MAG: Hpt domain-containing protein, partial [Campylobacterales bacterium]|nr:Hpt domain-containing protein [Campylobacterales bacterium]
MNPLLEQFLQEARENLKFIEENLEDLGSGDVELINSIFRAAHTLKGGAGLVGFESIKIVTHSCEDLLDMLRAGKLEFHDDMVDALYDGFDEVVNLVEAAEESGDTVEGDAEAIENIADRLKELMGKKDEVVEWDKPFNQIEETELVINKTMPWLSKFDKEIPFFLEELNEDNINDERLYGLFIDPEEDCMVYGNDPLYTFTLMEENLLGVECCTSKEMAENILSGEDKDGLELKVQFVSFGYGTWDDILDALYNFSDDLYVLPLDIATLLSITSGESQNVEVLKDIKEKAFKAIEEVNKDDLKNIIKEGKDLLNKDSKEAKILSRLKKLLSNINNSEVHYLKSVFENLGTDKPLVEKVESTKEESTPQQENSQPEAEETKEAPVEQKNSGAIDYGLVNYIIEQQIEQMELPASEEITSRVAHTINKCARYLNTEGCEDNKDAVDEWLKQHKNQKPEPIAVKTVAVEEKKPVEKVKPAESSPEKAGKNDSSGAKKEEKKPVVGKVVKVDQESIDQLMG